MKAKKLLATLSTVALLTMGATSASAAWDFGDTMDTAMVLYKDGATGGAYLPIDHYNDNDFYVVDNTNGYNSFNFAVSMTPPPSIDLDMQMIRVDANGQITDTSMSDYGREGEREMVGTSVQPGEKVYFRVMSHGYSDYGPDPYTIEFYKYN